MDIACVEIIQAPNILMVQQNTTTPMIPVSVCYYLELHGSMKM